jgi:geranylgeranyl diphosphate synthase type I
VLGVFGDPAVTGKAILYDLRAGKPTVMMALARGSADREQAARLKALFGNPGLDPDGAAELRGIIAGTGVLDRIEQMIRVRTEAALAALAAAPVTPAARTVLAGLAAEAVDRQR